MPADLIFEIGTEELPASFVEPTLQVLAESWRQHAGNVRLGFGAVETHGTPRRLALLVREVAETAEDVEQRAEGPAVAVAFDANGKPTRAAEGFARKFGLEVDQLQRVTTPQGERLLAVRQEKGQPALGLLPELLTKLIAGIPARKSMRWGNEDVTFPRPVRWICAVYGGEVVPVRYGDVISAGVTFGHRFLSPAPMRLTSCDEYVPRLREAKVLVSIPERREKVIEEIDRQAAAIDGRRVEDPELVDTITQLVEWPSGVLGTFDAEALEMPREVLVSEMRGHQKYASIESSEGKLLPAFVAVANTPVRDVAVSRRGYERVLRARLSDAWFFFREDQQRSLDSRVDDLKRVTFQEKLGSIHEKVERLSSVAVSAAGLVGRGEPGLIERAALLCKADLTTGMVGEFPELQGVMGREYARVAGEPEEVALAIFEHYLPRGAADELPTTDTGALVGIADRMDTLAGIFAIGKPPSGAADPFGLRRACLGVIRILLGRGYRLQLPDLVDAAVEQHYQRFALLSALENHEQIDKALSSPEGKKARKKKDSLLPRDEAIAQVLEFFRGRLRAAWSEEFDTDVVDAVLASGWHDVVDARRRLEALARIKGRPDFQPIALAFGRASNIIEKQASDLQPGPVNASLFREPVEGALDSAAQAAASEVRNALQSGDYDGALRALADLRPAVDAFFDQVLVMAEEADLRENRLRLVQSVQQLFAPIADFGRIQAR